MTQLETAVHAPVHTAPGVVDERSSLAGLRTVATFEAGKGIVVVALMLVLLAVHNRVEDLAWDLLFHLHIDPDRKYGEAFLKIATRLSDARLWTIALAGLTYSTVRFVEAWGLWNRRVWAEWFALLSGAMYLPWELLKFFEHRSWQHVAILAVNAVIVLYMLYVRVWSCRPPAQCDEDPRLA
jgi:uncharacterized membrane protein (DUF2068 family)